MRNMFKVMTAAAVLVLPIISNPAIAQPDTKAASAGCFISELSYYRKRLLHEIGVDPTVHGIQLDVNSGPLYDSMLKAINEAVAEKCAMRGAMASQ